MNKTIIAIGVILAAIGVVLGAFGAHALKASLIENGRLDTFQTAVDYHFIHSMGLILTGVLTEMKLIRSAKPAAWLFISGLILFSGSLYALCLSNISALGAITPFGGVAFIVAWSILAFQLLKKK